MFTQEILRAQFQSRFSDGAVEVFNLSDEEARRLDHSYIGTEHLLLGLCRKEDPSLKALGIEIGKVRTAVDFITVRGDRSSVAGDIALTLRARMAVVLGIDEERRMMDFELTPAHLLIGLVREGEGIAAGVLHSLDVNLNDLRTAVLKPHRSATYSLRKLRAFLADPNQDSVKRDQILRGLEELTDLIPFQPENQSNV